MAVMLGLDAMQGAVSIREAIDLLEQALEHEAAGRTVVSPKFITDLGVGAMRMLVAVDAQAGYCAMKAYHTIDGVGTRYVVSLYRLRDGALLALLDGQLITDMRTGAASGVAARNVPVKGPVSVGIIGSGNQARAQLESLAAVYQIESAAVFSPTVENRERYAREMGALTGIPVAAVASAEAKNTKELIAYIKSRPGQLNFASGGIGSIQHFAMELFLNMAKLKMTHVPYKGVAPATSDVIAGHVPMIAANILTILPHVKSGRVRAYGVSSLERSSAAPDLPTIAEALPGYEAVQWYGLVAPAGTPRPIVNKLHAAVVQALNDPAVKQGFQNGGADTTPSPSPEAYAKLIRAEIAKWAKVAKEAGIKPE